MSEENQKLYAVLRMQKTVKCTLFNGHEEDVEVQSVAGFIPLFETYEEALESSCDGKYQILQMKV